MPSSDLGFLSSPPTCSPFNLGDDYFTNFAINSVVSDALTAILPERYVNALQDATFFCNLKKFILYDAILDKWMFFVVNNLAKVIMAASVAFVTVWVLLAGLRIMTGSQREPIVQLLLRGAKIVLVMSLISALTKNTDTVIHTVLGLERSITQIVTGSSLTVDRLIDMNLAIGQFMNMVVEDVTNSVADQSSRRGSFTVFAGALGQTGPAILTSMLVMLSQIAICFALMLAPLFLFFLLFKGTTSLFWGWLKFLFSTFLALAFLSIVSTIAMSSTVSYGLMIALSSVLNSAADAGGTLGTIAEVAIRFLTGNLTLGTAARVDLGGAATNLAGMGALFALLIVATPPLIMQLFNASMGYASNLTGAMGMPRAGLGGGYAGAGAGQQPGYSPAALGHQGAAATSGNQNHASESDHSFSGTMTRQLLNHANGSNRNGGTEAATLPAISTSGTRGQLSPEYANGHSSPGTARLPAGAMGSHANPSATGVGNTGQATAANPDTPRLSGSHAENASNSPPGAGETADARHTVSDAKIIKEYGQRSGQMATQDLLNHSRANNPPRTQGLREHVAFPFGNRPSGRGTAHGPQNPPND
ncbi:type IV secretion system protein [Hydrogenophaga taeniospiralis]|uniref:type IV secretion system protein n=1 Tax=Hydrogenophaga taeniospiralis TaxID=65656 RepID=UPI001CF95D8C|nr:type IV secretion system protein [Hydrogenophaga taeniospiralis]MCB4366402.1 type IV secretion system protein [Hydrogenophaga taeniospiralis]